MKALASGLLFALALSLPSAEAQRVYRIGVGNGGFSKVNIFSPLSSPLTERLALVPALTKELVQLDVDVIVTIGNKVQPVVQQANPRIPIVSLSCDSFATVSNYARPNGNFTDARIPHGEPEGSPRAGLPVSGRDAAARRPPDRIEIGP